MRTDPGPAVAVFGSLARGDTDGLSDRDLLVVADSKGTRDRAREVFSRQGWNCTVYDWNRLEVQVRRGSLFAHHLRLEAKIVCDPTSRLREALEDVPRRSTYEPVLQEARDLLYALEGIPLTERGRVWAADVLMVALRGMAVARLAEDGQFAFSTDSIVDGLQARTASHGLWRAFRRLRELKASHRGRCETSSPSGGELLRLVEQVDRVFAVGLHASWSDHGTVIDMALRAPRSSDWYLWSRRLEAALELVDPVRTDAESWQEARRLLDIVRAPTDYGWMLHGAPGSLISSARDVLDRAVLRATVCKGRAA